MHFPAPFHPFQKHPLTEFVDVMNLALILLGILLALFMGPLRLE